MTLSPWLNRHGLFEHALAGAVLTLVLAICGANGFGALFGCAAMGIAHELGDGDFRKPTPGAPWNGVIDVVACLPVALLYWLLT